MCELARNSVIQSGFEMAVKKYWLGEDWRLPGPAGNSEYQLSDLKILIIVQRNFTLSLSNNDRYS